MNVREEEKGGGTDLWTGGRGGERVSGVFGSVAGRWVDGGVGVG